METFKNKIGTNATSRVPLNDCNPSAILALSCQNQIMIEQSYLPKIALRVKGNG